MQQTRLMRSESDKMIAGVCGGLAVYLGIDPVLVRLAFVILLLASGVGFGLYIILWIIMPTESRVDPEIRIMDSSLGDDPSAYKSRFGPAGATGVILILLGLFFLLGQVGAIPPFIWPLVLIAVGIIFLLRRSR